MNDFCNHVTEVIARLTAEVNDVDLTTEKQKMGEEMRPLGDVVSVVLPD
jgi:hypothetical protein